MVYFILKRNFLVIKLFQVVRLNALDIHLSVVAPIVLFVQLFNDCVISHGCLNGVLLN